MTKARDISRYGLGVGIQSASSVIAGVGITQLNFIGTGNTFRVSGGTIDIDIDGLTNTTNINTSGIITATSFSGTLTGSVNTSGIVTATGGFNIGIQSAGVDQATGVITAINFIGAGNTFRYNSTTKTIDVSISGSGGGGVSTTGITTAAFFSNPQYITTSYTLNSPNTNYGVFGPIYVSVGSTIIVGVGNTLAIL